MSNAPMGAGGTPAWEGRPHWRDSRLGGKLSELHALGSAQPVVDF